MVCFNKRFPENKHICKTCRLSYSQVNDFLCFSIDYIVCKKANNNNAFYQIKLEFDFVFLFVVHLSNISISLLGKINVDI